MENQTLTRKELYDLVWSTPFTTLAKKYSISDNGLRKICLKMDIPLPKSGHWGKLQFNKPVEITKLSSDYSGEQNVTLAFRQEGDDSKGVPSPETTLEKEIISKEGGEIIVPDKLTNPDKLIIQARDLLIEKRGYNSSDGIVNTYGHALSIRVTKDNISRALRFMDSFVKIIKKRGHSVEFENHTSFLIIQGEKIEFYLREKLKRMPIESNTSWQQYDKIPTGKLAFNVKISWQISEWKDGKLTLEEQLAKIIASLEIRGEKLKQERIEREKYWAEQREKERIEKDRQKQKELELDRFKKLLKNSNQWQEVKILRRYLDDTETKAKNNNTFTEEFENWLLWARKKADWYDPQINAEDELLKDTDIENLNITKKPNPYYYS